MKKNQNILMAACFLATLILGQSCSKSFLNEELSSSYSPSNTFTDSLGLEAGIAGLQYEVRALYTTMNPQGLLCTMQEGTDVARAGLIDGEEEAFYDYPTLSAENTAVAFYWKQPYVIINNANQIISSLSAGVSNLSEEGKNSYLAEARFYRAYAYEELSVLYGDVPLISAPLDQPKTDFTRTPVKDIINFMISDLTFSVAHLPDVDHVKAEGRINVAAAQQLLAEVYLRANKPDSAQMELEDIINSGKFQLVTKRYGVKSSEPGDPFSDMFIKGNELRSEGNTEGIWIQEQDFNVPGGTSSSDQHHRVWIPYYSNVPGMLVCDSLGGRGIGRIRLSNWVLYGLYGKGDMRNSPYNIRRTFYYNDPRSPNFGKQVVLSGTDTIYKICPYTTKWNWYDPAAGGVQAASFKDLITMRLGETYLLLAEAQFDQGNTEGAAASINVLRQRAFPDYPAEGKVSASDISMDFILDERARELIAEENRRMTLVRTGTLLSRATKYNADNIIGIQPFNKLLPIPQTEIDLNNSGTLTQNTGY